MLEITLLRMTPAKQGNRAGYCYGCNELDTEVRRASDVTQEEAVITHERHVCSDNVLMRPSKATHTPDNPRSQR
jgi:hypothetical protein